MWEEELIFEDVLSPPVQIVTEYIASLNQDEVIGSGSCDGQPGWASLKFGREFVKLQFHCN
jgi:hypothetical protein